MLRGMVGLSSLSNDVLPREVLRHGAYLCVRARDGQRLAELGIDALVKQFGFENEFDATNGHPSDAVAFLRRVDATPRAITDEALFRAEAVVHIASGRAEPVDRLCAEMARSLEADAIVAIMRGVVRPPSFTGTAMNNFAYVQQLQQQRGDAMPHAFIVPMRKDARWFAKSWLERHTYFLPRFDDAGRLTHEGHVLTAAPGIPHLMRRTYKYATEPAPDGAYDFVNYFECADSGVPVFFEVCAGLRDVARNPEWRFVQEGPTWRGRRVRSWRDLVDHLP